MILTSKDKMMLVILAVVIFLAVFYMYGIVPANEDLDAIEEQVKVKQEQVQALNDRLAAINTAKIDKKYNDLLEYYYANNNKVLDEPVTATYIDEMMFTLFEDCGFTGYSSQGWYPIQTSTQSAVWDDTNIAYDVLYVDCTSAYAIPVDNTVNAISIVNDFLDRVEANPSMEITSFTFNIVETTESVDDDDNPDTPPVEQIKLSYEGSFTLKYTMQVEIESGNIPALLANVTNLTNNGGTTISFSAVENAVSYEFYSFTQGEDGTRYYTLIPNATMKPQSNTGILNYTFSADALTGVQNIIVRAVGDKSAGYFKSSLDNSVPYVTVTFG